MSALRVGLLGDYVGDDWASPSTQLRFTLPWSVPSSRLHLLDARQLRGVPASRLRGTLDVLVTQRLEGTKSENVDLLYEARRADLPVVLDLDDDFLALRDLPNHEASGLSGELLARLEAELQMSDAVWAASTELADRVSAWNPNVRFRPTLPMPLGVGAADRSPGGDGPLRLLYFGTQTHKRDWALVEPQLRRLHDEGLVEVTVIGILEPDPEGWVRALAVPSNAISRWFAFHDYVRRQGPFDVGIAPLANDSFSRAKSTLKLWEYLELGLLPLASDLPPYAALGTLDARSVVPGAADWGRVVAALAAEGRSAVRARALAVREAAGLDEQRRQVLAEDESALRALVALRGAPA